MGTLWNVYSFYVLYAELDKFNPLHLSTFNGCIIVVYMLQYNESVSGSNYRKLYSVR